MLLDITRESKTTPDIRYMIPYRLHPQPNRETPPVPSCSLRMKKKKRPMSRRHITHMLFVLSPRDCIYFSVLSASSPGDDRTAPAAVGLLVTTGIKLHAVLDFITTCNKEKSEQVELETEPPRDRLFPQCLPSRSSRAMRPPRRDHWYVLSPCLDIVAVVVAEMRPHVCCEHHRDT